MLSGFNSNELMITVRKGYLLIIFNVILGFTFSLNSQYKAEEVFELLPIPKREILTGESNRNPFISLRESGEKLTNFLPKEIRFSGIGTIGESKVLFVDNRGVIDSYKIGDKIANGFSVVSINFSPDQAKISNGVKNYLVKFKKK
tara:strand:+ start:3455 stop:3889 length:435 start_codon:yes stop_codon:yes gene_type:complete